MKGYQRLTEDRDGTRAPSEERLSVPFKRTLQGAQRRGLVEAAPFPTAGAGGDASGARPNWDDIATSAGKTTSRFLAVQERSESIE